MKQIHIKLNEELHSKIKQYSEIQGVSIQDFVMGATSQVLKETEATYRAENADFRFIDLFAGIGE